MIKASASASKLYTRNAQIEDIEGIIALSAKVYPRLGPYAAPVLQGQINNFPEGQFVAVFNGSIVGYCASIRLKEAVALSTGSWRELTGNGFGSTHDPEAEFLYGIEIMVDPDFRRLKIGERLYRERRNLVKSKHLKGIIFAGRMPLIKKRLKPGQDIEEYIDQVRSKKIKDPVLSFQFRQGFELMKIVKDYLQIDVDSLGYAAQMIWRNPEYTEIPLKASRIRGRITDSIRVASVQYLQRSIGSFKEFERIVSYFVDVVADYKADFVLFPELFTLQLLSIDNVEISPEKSIARLTDYTEPLKEMFNQLAIRYNVNIIAGSHPTKVDSGAIKNISYVFLRDGSIHEQAKIHPTPNESYWWNLQGGDTLNVINTDVGPIGVLICYDSEFPELARHLVDQGANILFVPFCTDERQSYLRVRYCAQARAVENQCYVVMSGNVGNLPNVHNMDIQYAQSCILTPCDFPFARDGIAADTTPNTETVAIADLRLDLLMQARVNGTVLNLRDRRHDLYSVTWHKR